MTLGHLNRYKSKRFREHFPTFCVSVRKVDVRKGMPSFAWIPVTLRTLFKKNRGGTDPPGGRGLRPALESSHQG